LARVVVIGAGLSGLAAAARLARLRHDVTVVERSAGPGGAAGRLERDGFAFDTGPTLLHLPAGWRDLFVKTGRNAPLEAVLELRPVDPAVRWEFADGSAVDLPNATRAGVGDALTAAFGPTAAAQWDAFIATGDEVWAQFRQGFLSGPLPAASGWRTPRELRAAHAALHPARSYRDLMRRHLKDPRLRQAAGGYLLRLGCDPDLAPATAVLWPWLEQTFGAWEVVGGIRVLVDAVETRARQRGARFRYETTVAGIETAGGAVVAVRLVDQETLPADVVVAALDDQLLHGLCPGAVPKPGERSAGFCCLLLALRADDPGPATTVSFPAAPQEELAALRKGSPNNDPTVFRGRATAPAGAAAWTVITPAGRGAGPETAEHLVRVLDARGHRVSERLLWREFLTPQDLAARTGAPGGAAIGPALHGSGALHRPPNATPIRGLFHVGSAAHPGPGIALAPLGSALVADAVGRARPD
jgi:phytoene dehydrogenase-like protein